MADEPTEPEASGIGSRELAPVQQDQAYLSWVAATRALLRALGVPVEADEVAAHSGYAFLLTIGENGGVSSPNASDPGALTHGLRVFGVEATAYRGGLAGEGAGMATRLARRRHLFACIRDEIDAGHPVGLWGARQPEWGVAYGYDGAALLVVPERKTPLTPESLEPAGGTHALFMRPARPVDRTLAERVALQLAVDLHSGQRGVCGNAYTQGDQAWADWIAVFESGDAETFGQSYTLAGYAEARTFAASWLTAMTARHPDVPSLKDAATHYTSVRDALVAAASIYPFPMGSQDTDARPKIATHLRQAHDAERSGIVAIQKALSEFEKGSAAP